MDRNEVEIRKLRQDLDRLNTKLRQPVRPHRTQDKTLSHKELNVADLKVGDLKEREPVVVTDKATDTDFLVMRIGGNVVKFEGTRI
jgi:hypothetical protein